MINFSEKTFKQLLVVFLLFMLWLIISRLQIFSTYVFPSPQKVFDAFIKMIVSGELFTDILISFVRVIKGFSVAFILAFILGMTTYLTKLDEYYDFIIQFFRNVPPLSLIPLLILWCGIGETTKIIIIILASFFPMYLNVVKGFTECDKKLLEVGKVFGYSKIKSFFKITLPYAMSDILIGMRIGLGYSWRAIIGAEMVAASSGLGYLILFSQQTSRTDKVIVGIFVIGFVGYLCDKLFELIIKKILKGSNQNEWN